MRAFNFGETLSFGLVRPSSGPRSATVLVQEKCDFRIKEEFSLEKSLVPSRFTSTVICCEKPKSKKNFRSTIRYEIGNRPRSFSVTCYLTPKRKDRLFRSSSEYHDPTSPYKAVNHWFTSSVFVATKEVLHRLEGINLVEQTHSTKFVVADPPEEFYAHQSFFKKGRDFNHNLTQRPIGLSYSSVLSFFGKRGGANCSLPVMHNKCRNTVYPRTDIERQLVPDDKVSWGIAFPDYSPPTYTSESVFGKPWADPNFGSEGDLKSVQWNVVDETSNVDRTSFMGNYSFFESGLPRNPVGRTGLQGRGLLGRWGPNHAGDPIVTRWARDGNRKKVINKISGKPQLQFVSIQRKDSKEWAIPGGMVDPGEMITETLKREFAEEALNCLEKSEKERDDNLQELNKAFKKGVEIYKGYVDDPRNTDNAWMETVAFNFHDDKGDLFNMNFHAGDDAIGVRWMDIDRNVELYASHKDFIEEVVKRRQAHW